MTTEQKQVNKNSLMFVFRWIVSILKLMFPSITIYFKIHRNIKRMSSFYDNEWFNSFLSKNLKIMFILIIPPIISSLLIFARVSSFYEVSGKNRSAGGIYYIKNLQVKAAYNYYKKTVFTKELKSVIVDCSILFLVPIVIGGVVIGFHPILRMNRRLKKSIASAVGASQLERDGKDVLSFWTPVGVMIDTFGKDPKELSQNNALWAPLNIQINKDDWRVDPENQTVVVFLSKFKLQDKYIFTPN